MQMKRASYSLVSAFTYIFCYKVSDLVMSGITFSIVGLVFSILYIIIGLKLVEKYAPMTFKIN